MNSLMACGQLLVVSIVLASWIFVLLFLYNLFLIHLVQLGLIDVHFK